MLTPRREGPRPPAGRDETPRSRAVAILKSITLDETCRGREVAPPSAPYKPATSPSEHTGGSSHTQLPAVEVRLPRNEPELEKQCCTHCCHPPRVVCRDTRRRIDPDTFIRPSSLSVVIRRDLPRCPSSSVRSVIFQNTPISLRGPRHTGCPAGWVQAWQAAAPQTDDQAADVSGVTDGVGSCHSGPEWNK